MPKISSTLVATIAVLLALPGAAFADLPETLSIDLHTQTNVPVLTSVPLADGQPYTATVAGGYSIVSAARWANALICGAPGVDPYPSPGVTDGPISRDAETVFAETRTLNCDADVLPRTHVHFQIDTGAGFAHVPPAGGDVGIPAPDHVYVFHLTGHGAPAGFQLSDTITADNYGQLKIVVVAGDVAAPAPTPTPTPVVAPLDPPGPQLPAPVPTPAPLVQSSSPTPTGTGTARLKLVRSRHACGGSIGATVRGAQITRVTFAIGSARSVRARHASAIWSFRIGPKARVRPHPRLTVRVTFADATPPATLVRRLASCAAPAKHRRS